MNIPAKFDPIRPYEPEELPVVYERLIADSQFRAVMEHVFSGVPYDALAAKIRSYRTNLEFQKQLCYGFLVALLAKASDGCTMDSSRVDVGSRYTFMSNHRDIVLDSAFLDKMLFDAGFGTTCEIAIGDNLLAAPWIEDLVRVNKSFIVRRSAAIKEMLANSRLLSEYMHFVIAEKHDNVWIAQREGRAKDSDDRTQQSLLKMMAMGGEGSVAERLAQLHIVPLSISYEYDPCDYLKAREFQLKRDVEGWRKTKADDVMSMQTGIMGRKGHIHYHCAPCIDGWLGTLPEDMPKGELFAAVARHIDREIHLGYRLYPNNYAAADLLHGNRDFADRYTSAERTAFEEYIAGRIALIDLPEKDEDYLRERLLTMYANPAINQVAAQEETV